ncbi:MAG: tRNA lysidine(34) synthetase TilS [Oscillospiraceae bacterium]
MTKKYIEFFQQYAIEPSEGILCAVSGGKDSMFLLDTMQRFAQECGVRMVCAHFNHCLRGAESERDAAFVQQFCAERAILCCIGSGDVAAAAARRGTGIEETARDLRYAFLVETADQMNCKWIVTAHNADDNAETILLNLARGSGLRGLSGIPPVRGRILRPMLELTRDEIEAYLEEHHIPNVEDSSNAADDYSRNRLRHHVMPTLREINAQFSRNAGRTAALLREDEAFLQQLAAQFLAEQPADKIHAAALAALPRPVSARVLRRVCGSALSAVHIEQLRALCYTENPYAMTDVPGMRVRREREYLVFGTRTMGILVPRTILPNTVTLIPEAGLEVYCTVVDVCPEIHKTFNILFFQCETIYGNIAVTSRAEGDTIRLAGRNCTKRLKKLFSEAKLTPEQRNQIPVFRDARGVIGICGFGVDERCAARPGDRAIRIEIKKTGENER